MADIQAMYHQVKVAEQDTDFLRFLWWPNGELTQHLTEYRMTVHLFGAISSPSCASFALRKTADDNREEFPAHVINTIKQNFYVDDCLKSMPSEAEAMALVGNLTAVCQLGGFQLLKWVSNSRSVLESIDAEKRAKEMKGLDFDRDNLPVERILGLQWCAETDTFRFKMAVQERPFTRRGILSVVSSVYDPIGFLAPFTLPAKLMLQNLCRLSYSWDDLIPPHYQLQWVRWLEDLKGLSVFSVSRCIKPKDFGKLISVQLHHFSDASEDGYGTVSYLRLKNHWDKIHLAFILGKARVAPVKKVTIPRMELTAAVLAVRVDRMLKAELQLELESSIFWTDSTTVLKYIRNETKRFHTFVSNRISIIREATVVSQWRWVREYIPLLQERQRWSKDKRSFVAGDIVLVADSTAPRGSWLLGKVLQTFPDKQGLGDLLNPCRCDGSVRYTHQHCLLKWISERGCWTCELCCYRFHVIAINLKTPRQWQSITITLVEKVQIIAVFLGSLFLVSSISWLLWSTLSPQAIWQRRDLLFQICYGMYGFMDLVCLGLIVHEGAAVYNVFMRWRAVNLHWDLKSYDKAKDMEETSNGHSSLVPRTLWLPLATFGPNGHLHSTQLGPQPWTCLCLAPFCPGLVPRNNLSQDSDSGEVVIRVTSV
ncbi:hypothetical protein EPR50_G00132240 [Perca flavescens]|uniref:RING-CH-type domain-containing protein n=1 Tax=Perca flavescens TaxID=8167 RepID=A0A484CRS4_PERFV|nr:hypothetical protein EPR50_G00132240 [Perca flavescens]